MAEPTSQSIQRSTGRRSGPVLSRHELRHAVEVELARGSPWRTFADRLEAHYIKDTGARAIEQDRQAAILAVIIFNCWVITDYLSAPDIWLQAFLFRAFIASPLLLALTWADRKGRGLRLRSRNQAILLGLTTLPLLAIYHESYFPTVTACYFLFPMILVFGNLSISINFVWVVVSNLITWLAFCATVSIDNTVPIDLRPILIVSMTSLLVITLKAKYRIEGSERRAWLLAKLESFRSQDLRDLAITFEEQSLTDPLTGAANRRHFDAMLSRMHASEPAFALILLDVDHFKAYNDRYGHPAGDKCLKRLVRILHSQVRTDTDVVARYGGEEFVVLLAGCGLAAAVAVAEHIRLALAAAAIPGTAKSENGYLSASLGVSATSGPARMSPAEMIAEADRRLYLAKANGRNRVEPPPAAGSIETDPDDIAWVDAGQSAGHDGSMSDVA